MKLGLIIKITGEGEKQALALNSDNSWAKYTSDVRGDIDRLVNFDGTEKNVLLLRFLGNKGLLLGLVKARPQGSGRVLDNTTAWLHIPSMMAITGASIIEVITLVKDAVSNVNGKNLNSLHQAFNVDYPEKKDVLVPILSNVESKAGGNIAARYYDNKHDNELENLLGKFIVQRDYKKYSGLFLIDKHSDISLKKENVLTSELVSYSKVLPPELRAGFTPSIVLGNKYEKFNRSIETLAQTKLKIRWTKERYKSIDKEIITLPSIEGYFAQEMCIVPEECFLIVKKTMFSIQDESGMPLSNVTIKIDGNHFIGETMELSEKLLSTTGVNVSFLCKDYENCSLRLDKAALFKQHKISMTPIPFKYIFELPLCIKDQDHSGSVNVSLETKKALVESPIEGYVSAAPLGKISGIENRVKLLNTGFKTKIKFYLFGVLSVVFVCAFIFSTVKIYTEIDEFFTKNEWAFAFPPFKPKKTDSTSSKLDKSKSVSDINKIDSLSVKSEESLSVPDINKIDSVSVKSEESLSVSDINKPDTIPSKQDKSNKGKGGNQNKGNSDSSKSRLK